MTDDTYCASCGRELPEGGRFCPGCGARRGGAVAPTVIDEPTAEVSPPGEVSPPPAGRDAPPPASPDTTPPAPPHASPAPAEGSPPGGADTVRLERGSETGPQAVPPAEEADSEPLERRQAAAPPPHPGVADPGRAAPARSLWRTDQPEPGAESLPPSGSGPSGSAPPPGPVPPPPSGSAPPHSRHAGAPGEATRPPQLGDAAQLARRLGAEVRRPAVATALAGGVLAALATLVFGLLIAIAFPDENSIIGALGNEAGIVTETLRQAVSFLQVAFDDLPLTATTEAGPDVRGRVAPLLFLAVPVSACAVAAAAALRRIPGPAPRTRLVACAGLALVFAVLMLVAALACGDADPSAAGTFFRALLWGLVGALLGASPVLRREAPSLLPKGRPPLPPALAPLGRAVGASLRPLAVLLIAAAVIGTGAWVVHGLIDDGNDEDRARTTVEVALFAADHGVHFAELGVFASFEPSLEDAEEGGLPAPTGEPDEVGAEDGHRIFAYRDALPAYLFVPGVIVLIALPLLLALYAGFITAGAAGATRSPGLSAAWGALVGPVWAIVMVILDALATKSIEQAALGRSGEVSLFGSADGGSTFLLFLLIGAVLGGLGGLLAGSAGSGSAAGNPARS